MLVDFLEKIQNICYITMVEGVGYVVYVREIERMWDMKIALTAKNDLVYRLIKDFTIKGIMSEKIARCNAKYHDVDYIANRILKWIWYFLKFTKDEEMKRECLKLLVSYCIQGYVFLFYQDVMGK